MFAILNIPGAKVDRVEFLVEALRPHCTDEEIKKAALQCPIDVVSEKLIAKIADDCIVKEAKMATLVSTVLLPHFNHSSKVGLSIRLSRPERARRKDEGFGLRFIDHLLRSNAWVGCC